MINRYLYEEQLWGEGYKRVMGLDEVGRGCLCGPVVAAGVIIKPGSKLSEEICDSKKLTDQKRRILSDEIKETAEFWAINEIPPSKIDQINILQASLLAMSRCETQEGANPDYLLVDGNRYTTSLISHTCVVKGDDKSVSIGAASILAKVYRDDLMKRLHEEYPFYDWAKNVGYPTKKHFEGLLEYGYTKHHRKSFKLRTEKVFGN